ncbi:MAG: hypothetical protein JST80_05130 [Bdellovibrionales bacterium]|nr:hypothetical protein [Bdellovibrionales bacterium]
MIVLLATLLASIPAQAAFQSTTGRAALPARATPVPRWLTKVESKYSGSFIGTGMEGNASNFSMLATTAFRVTDRMVMHAVYGFNQIINPTNRFTFANPEFRMFYRLLGSAKGWSLSAGPTAALPLSQESRDQSLYFAVGAAVRLACNGKTDDDIGFRFYYDLGFNRNNHQWETSNSGESNTMSSIDHYFVGEYSFDRTPITVSAWLGFSSAWSYMSVVSNNYTIGQEASFAASENVDLAIGHERGGDVLSPSGQSYNFGLFNAQESRFYLSMTFKI